MQKIRLSLMFTFLILALVGHAHAKPGWGDCSASYCHGAPVVTNFQLPASHDALTVPVEQFAATDSDTNNKTSVNGYMLTTSATPPGSGDAGWQSSPPSEYTFGAEGLHTLYAWAKDSFGSVSTAVSGAVDIMVPVPNTPPVADAGPDQSIAEGGTVTLDGTNSNDTDDGIRDFFWEQTNGSITVVLSDAYAEQPFFDAPVVGPEGVALTFTLTVTDWSGETHSDTCIVNITNVNVNPVADAGSDQTVSEGAVVMLNGAGSSGVDDNIAQYYWEQINVTGVTVDLNDPTIANPQFVLDAVDPQGESITLQLTVTDDGGLQATDTVVINITNVNQAPMAHAGADQSMMAGDQVTLDASGSGDPDGELTNNSYTWKQTAGMAVTLSDPGAINPVFTAPDVAPGTTDILTFELTVTDGLLQATDSCDVAVTAESLPPVEEPPVEEPPVEEPPVEEPPVVEPPVEEPPVVEPPTDSDDSDDSDDSSYEDDDEDDKEEVKERDRKKRKRAKRLWKWASYWFNR